jgi:hypothetical protein
MHRVLLAGALVLVLSLPVIARDVKCDRHVENGRTLQRCEFVETPPQTAASPPSGHHIQLSPDGLRQDSVSLRVARTSRRRPRS